MFNVDEAEERQYLEAVRSKLREALREADDKISSSYREVIEAKTYIWQNLSQLDPAERAANRMEVSLAIDSGEKTIVKHGRLVKLLQAPYFGRIDFIGDDEEKEEPYYIGVHSFAEDSGYRNLI